MKVIRREGFDYQGRRYEIVVEHVDFKLKATAMRNGRAIKRSEVQGDAGPDGGYDTDAGMKAVDALIELAQTRVRALAR
jgi:hypothetical protein